MSAGRSTFRKAVAVLAIAFAAAPLAQAQETSAQLSGFVIGPGGQPIEGAAVSVEHLPSGTVSMSTSGSSGQFTVTGLRVGGPFRVSTIAEGMQEVVVEDLHTQVGQRTSVILVAQSITQLADVEVTGASERNVTIGAGSHFGARDVRELPSISRDIKDVVRIDPRAWVDPTNSDALEVAGVNNRYNTLTVDGVRQSDDFGLNNNGYPTQRSPLSIDAIQDVAILTAPFSVEYGLFRGSTINVVTKSGTNEYSGSGYYYTSDDSLAGDPGEDRDVTFTFDEETYGGTFGGPIVKDRLFFFLSYETLERTAPQEVGPTGSDSPVQVPNVSQADYEQILQIAQDVYGFDAGDSFDELLEEDEKILAKIDWNISDSHRAAYSYQRTEGNEIITSNNTPSLNRASAPSQWYNRAITMEANGIQLFSDWNAWLSTEVKLARKETEVRQDSLFGTEFAEMQVTTSQNGQVYLGPDESRHANYLTNDLDQFKFKGNVFLADHTLTIGFERESLEIFNLFLPRSRGQYVFTSIANFENQIADSLVYNNAFTNNPDDGAATFGYDVDSVYFQDEWQLTPDLKLQGGLRLDSYSSGDRPLLNQNFSDRYDFSNRSTLDGRELLMPRIGFNWQWLPETTIYGGWGLFGGGSPNVWVSNSFSVDGVNVIEQTINRDPLQTPVALMPALDDVDGFNINPLVLDNHELLRGDSQVNAIDPDFEIPSQYRWNLGIKQTLPWDVEMTADLVISRVKDEVVWRDLRLIPNPTTPTAPDGRPRYISRADRSPCNPGQTPESDGLCTRPSGQDLLLTNTNGGEGAVFAIDFAKTWRTGAGRIDAYLGYGYQDVKDVNSGTSSTALSNWDSYATADPNDPELQTSNYEMQHQFKAALSWNKALIGDYETSVGLIGERRSGRGYSYTFGAGTGVFGDPRQASRQRALLYVPNEVDVDGTLVDDVIYEAPCSTAQAAVPANNCAGTVALGFWSSTIPEAGVFAADVDAFVERHGLEKYRGRIVPRNSHNSPWLSILDMRLSQEIPVWGRLRGAVTLDIENLANLIDNDWGQLNQVSFIYVAPVLDAQRIATTGCPLTGQTSCYVYRPRAGQTGPSDPVKPVSALPSVWRVQLGVRFEF